MTSKHDGQITQPTRLNRRTLIQAGSSSLAGVSLSSVLKARASAAGKSIQPASRVNAKQIVIVWLTGAASHHDTFEVILRNRISKSRISRCPPVSMSRDWIGDSSC